MKNKVTEVKGRERCYTGKTCDIGYGRRPLELTCERERCVDYLERRSSRMQVYILQSRSSYDSRPVFRTLPGSRCVSDESRGSAGETF